MKTLVALSNKVPIKIEDKNTQYAQQLSTKMKRTITPYNYTKLKADMLLITIQNMAGYDVAKLLNVQQNLVRSVRVTILSGSLFQGFIVLGIKEPKKNGDLQLSGTILHKLSQHKNA